MKNTKAFTSKINADYSRTTTPSMIDDLKRLERQVMGDRKHYFVDLIKHEYEMDGSCTTSRGSRKMAIVYNDNGQPETY